MSAEELKNNEGQIGQEGQDDKKPTRSEERQKDLADKLIEQEKRHTLLLEEKEKELAKVQEEAQKARFEADWNAESAKYPFAKEHREDIESYVKKGLSVSEATTLVLGKNNKLLTAEQVTKNNIDVSSYGGSATILPQSGKKDPEQMTQDERRAELQRLEQEGKIGFKDGGIFIRE